MKTAIIATITGVVALIVGIVIGAKVKSTNYRIAALETQVPQVKSANDRIATLEMQVHQMQEMGKRITEEMPRRIMEEIGKNLGEKGKEFGEQLAHRLQEAGEHIKQKFQELDSRINQLAMGMEGPGFGPRPPMGGNFIFRRHPPDGDNFGPHFNTEKRRHNSGPPSDDDLNWLFE